MSLPYRNAMTCRATIRQDGLKNKSSRFLMAAKFDFEICSLIQCLLVRRYNLLDKCFTSLNAGLQNICVELAQTDRRNQIHLP